MTLPMQAIKTFGFVPQLIASRTADGVMRVEGVGSSTVRDHHGDTFSLKALQKMAAASKDMVVFMNHGYEVPKDVFGKIETVRLARTGEVDPRTKQEIWDLRLGIIVASSNPDAVKNFELIDKDKINLGISIGAMLPEGGYTFDKEAGGRLLIDDVEPIEFSMVGIPANPRSFSMIDNVVKSIVGAFPDSKKFAGAWDRFVAKAGDPVAESTGDDEAIDAGPITQDELRAAAARADEDDDEPLEEINPDDIKSASLGDVVELVVDADGNGTTTVVAKAGTPEAAEFIEKAKGPLVPVEALTEGIDVDHFDAEPVDKALAGTVAGIGLDAFIEGKGVVPELEKAEWSSAYVDKLPASAFACPKQRAYPHHDANGKVDPAHLRAALSRIGDSSNTQCAGGKAHLEAHARKMGIGEPKKSLTKAADSKSDAPLETQDGDHQHPHAHVHNHEHTHGYGDSTTTHDHEHAHVHSHDHGSDHEHRDEYNDYAHNHPHNGSYDDSDHAHSEDAMSKSVEPDLAKSKVSVWENADGSKVVEVDTGRSKPKADDDQSVQASATPDTTGGLGDAEGGESGDAADLRAAEALVAKSHNDAAVLLRKVIGQLKAVKDEAAQLRKERDAAIEIAQRTMAGTKAILDRVGELPVGRKAVGYPAIKDSFDDLSEIYSADVRKHLTPAKRS